MNECRIKQIGVLKVEIMSDQAFTKYRRTPSGPPADFWANLRIRVLTFTIVKTGLIDNIKSC